MKRTDAQIYMLCHKQVEYGLLNNELYTPLEVGAECRKQPVAEVRDNTGDNISEYKSVMAEMTGVYWIWKNLDTPIIGQCQYRRRLILPEDFDFKKCLGECKGECQGEPGENFKAITCKPVFFNCSVADQFAACHSKQYLQVVEAIVKSAYPDFKDSWDKYILKSNKLYYSNSFILKKEDYNEYCSFYFDIMNKFFNYYDLRTIEDVEDFVLTNIRKGLQHDALGMSRGYFYSMQLGGFIAERLWTLWVRHKFEGNIFEVPYTLMENTGI